MVNTMTPPSLFAGKVHALLYRNWSSRPKGRDWYDLVWYISHEVELDLRHLSARLQQSCNWQESQNMTLPDNIDNDSILMLLRKRIETLNIAAAKRDIEPFISNRTALDLWSREFFITVVNRISFIKEKGYLEI